MKLKTCILLGLTILPACTQTNEPRPQSASAINGVQYAPLEQSRRPRPASIVAPLYPGLADEKHLEGFVDFEFTIAPDGSVVDPKITREEPANLGFAQAAARVFVYWKFQPNIVGGVAVATPARYRMSFKLAR